MLVDLFGSVMQLFVHVQHQYLHGPEVLLIVPSLTTMLS